MKSFLRGLLTATLGYVLGSVIVLLILFWIISSSISSAQKSSKVAIQENSVLYLEYNGPLQERVNDDPFTQAFGGMAGIDLTKTIFALEQAKTDDRIQGLILDLKLGSGGMASLEALRRAVEDFKSGGKFVYAYGDIYTEKAFYLASVADKIYLNPNGYLEWNGLVAEGMFLRGLLDRWGMDPVLFRVGKYKSAAEKIVQKAYSEENRAQVKALLDDLWNRLVAQVAKSRKLKAAALDQLATEMTIETAEDAKTEKLVDVLAYKDVFRTAVREKVKLEKDDELRLVTPADYYDARPANTSDNHIAVVFATGQILYGTGDDASIGNETLVKELRKVREDDKVKAVVLRVNSPGGSALASDIIWRELTLLKKAKPLIVSQGDVAASGGYYLSAPADKVFAERTTITGSIGVIGLLLNTQQFFNRELGITFDRIYSNENQLADLGNPNRPMREEERKKIQDGVDEVYEDFLGIVQEGRGFKSRDDVHEIAQGRVWTGEDAKGINLIDEFGGLQDAIAAAAKKAGVEEDHRLVLLPKMQSPFELFLNSQKEAPRLQHALESVLGTEGLQQLLQLEAAFKDPTHVYARCGACPEIR